MPYTADRAKDSTTSTGTGAITLSGTAPSGFQTFADGFGTGSTLVYYAIEGGAEWEVGIGTFDGTTGLTREKVLASSNAGALVSLSAGTKTVFSDAPEELVSNIGSQLAMRYGWAIP